MATTTTQTTNTDNADRSPTIGIGAINLLKSPLATLVVLCSALLAQLPHAADVFRMIVMGSDWLAKLHSYTYAVALELAVLLFVVQRRNIESYFFAFVSILVNLSYYYLHGVALISIAALPAWLISIALPLAIAQYSHLIAASVDGVEGRSAKPAKPARLRRHFWQFWRPRAEPTAATNMPQATRQTGLESTGGMETATVITESELEAPSGKPTGTAQASGDEGKPAGASDGTPDQLTPAQRKAQRRMQIAEWQLQSPKQVMDTFGVGKRTADEDLAWVRKNAMHTNGVAK